MGFNIILPAMSCLPNVIITNIYVLQQIAKISADNGISHC
jgi:hypothetical protein